jgi:anti-anti-sigma factor
MMKTTIQQQDGNLVAVLEGRLDTAAAAATEKELQPLYDCEGKNIVFDCSKLEFISSSGLRLFLGVLKAAKPKGSKVCITGMSNELKDVFTITGFTSLFEFK